MSNRVAIIDNVGIKAGMDKYSDGMARGLVENGSEIWLMSNFSGDAKGVHYSELFNKKREGVISDLKNWIVPWRKAARLSKTAGVEHVIIHLFSFGLKDRLALAFLTRNDLKVHAIVHDPEHLGRGEGPLEFKDSILDSCYKLYVHNQVSASFLPERFNGRCGILPHGNFHDIPSEITRSEAKAQLGWTDGLPKVLFFGQIKQSKGLEVLIEAMSGLKERAQLVIAGRPWQEDASAYTELITKAKVDAETHLRFITNEERDLFLKASDLIVMPYRKIFQSGVLQMAFSYRIPVICSDLPAFQELDPGQELMTRFASEDSNALAQAISTSLDDEDSMQAKAERAYQFAATECSWEAIAKRFDLDS